MELVEFEVKDGFETRKDRNIHALFQTIPHNWASNENSILHVQVFINSHNDANNLALLFAA